MWDARRHGSPTRRLRVTFDVIETFKVTRILGAGIRVVSW
jgi:hypothetical protein